jgi:tRNA pseudouridine38-40 synthase
MSIQRWKCVCAYDGGSFSGWQSQADGNAIQDKLEKRLKEIFREEVRVHGSGRTDAGVHARGQVFHFDAEWRHDSKKLMAALGVGLPRAVQIKSVRAVSKRFHARFSAFGKRYDYRIHMGDADPFTRPYCWPVFRPLDLLSMQHCATILRGEHDFRAFTVLNGPPREDTTRNLRRLDVLRRGKVITVTAEADGFMYKMVRSLVGVLVAVGENRLTVDRVAEILGSHVRTPEVQTAPPHGLFLTRVFYAGKKSGDGKELEQADVEANAE